MGNISIDPSIKYPREGFPIPAGGLSNHISSRSNLPHAGRSCIHSTNNIRSNFLLDLKLLVRCRSFFAIGLIHKTTLNALQKPWHNFFPVYDGRPLPQSRPRLKYVNNGEFLMTTSFCQIRRFSVQFAFHIFRSSAIYHANRIPFKSAYFAFLQGLLGFYIRPQNIPNLLLNIGPLGWRLTAISEQHSTARLLYHK